MKIHKLTVNEFEIFNIDITQSKIPIIINCNAFGSGEHETTQSCLRVISQLELSGKTVLDIGAGTGILAITAMKKGARLAVCFDISYESALNIAQNTAINCLNNIFSVCSTIEAIKSSYDVIFANIYSSIILKSVEKIDNLLKSKGIVVASGINYEYNFDVRSAFEKLNYKVLSLEFLEDYVTVVLQK